MARPNKIGLDYFPLDVDIFEDEKMSAISGEFGIKGEITVIKLLCAIYRNGYYILWNDLLKFKLLKNLPGISSELIESIVNRLVLWGFFDKSLFDSVKVLTSRGIQKRYFEAVRRRKDFGNFPYLLNDDVCGCVDKDIHSTADVKVNAGNNVCGCGVNVCNNPSTIDGKPSIIVGENIEPGINVCNRKVNVCNNSTNADINVNKNPTKKRKEKESKEKESNIPPAIPPCGDAAAKSWRDDFEIYRSELKEAFDKIISDKDFIENRQKYHPNLDIRLSMQKAYEDYWATEAGWKKKKSSRTKEIDWPATFRKALDQPQNRVYKQNGVSKPEPERAMSELQERFAMFLRKEAPLLLDMPLQPSDEEVGVLIKIRKEILLDIVKKINNDKYLTTRKNSVFQTIMELKQKEYGT